MQQIQWHISVVVYTSDGMKFNFLYVVLDNLKYTSSHEWVKHEGTVATIGVTDHAQVCTSNSLIPHFLMSWSLNFESIYRLYGFHQFVVSYLNCPFGRWY